MREIKFRGYSEDLDKWVYGDLLQYRVLPIIFDEECEQHECFAPSIGQSTGLFDKNGKEIYEGDIVSFEDSDGGYEYQDLVINTGIVEYGELRFYFTNRVAVEMDDFYIKDGRCDDIEVIGNIYENPELLET